MRQYFAEIMSIINLEMAKKGAVMVKVRFIFLSDLTHWSSHPVGAFLRPNGHSAALWTQP